MDSFAWLKRTPLDGNQISSTQGATPDPGGGRYPGKDAPTTKELELEVYLDTARKRKGQFDAEKQEAAANQFEQDYAEKEKENAPNFEAMLYEKEESIVGRIWAMLMGRLLPVSPEDSQVVGYTDTLGVGWYPGIPKLTGKKKNMVMTITDDTVGKEKFDWDWPRLHKVEDEV